MSRVNLEIAIISSVIVVTVVASSFTFVYINHLMYSQSIPDTHKHYLVCNITGYGGVNHRYVTVYYGNNSSITFYGDDIFNGVRRLKLGHVYNFTYQWDIFLTTTSDNDTHAGLSCLEIRDIDGNVLWTKSYAVRNIMISIFVVFTALSILLYMMWRDKYGGVEEN